MIYDRMNSILEQNNDNEDIDSLFESIILDIQYADIEVPLRNGITESMLYRHNIMKGSIMYPLFEALFEDEEKDYKVDDDEYANWNPKDETGKDSYEGPLDKEDEEDNSSSSKNNKNGFLNKLKNFFKKFLDKIIQWFRKAILFVKEKLFNNEKFIKEHQKELDEIISKNKFVYGKSPSITLASIEKGTSEFYKYSRALITENTEDLISIFSTLSDDYNDTMELKESIRKSYLNEFRGKNEKINLEESINILKDYGREYLDNLNECYKAAKKMKRETAASASEVKKVASSFFGKEGGKNLAESMKKDSVLLITLYQEIFMIFRQGIYEHELILKMAIQGKLKPVEK